MTGALVRQFDVFAQLIAQGTIAACARELDLPPADVIAAMNALEDRMGFALFSMDEDGVALTEAGRKTAAALGALSAAEQEQWANAVAADAMPPVPLPARPDYVAPGEEDAPSHSRGESVAEAGDSGRDDGAEQPAEATPRHFRPMEPRASAEDAPSRSPVPAPAPDHMIILASHPAIFSHFQEALVAFEEASPDIGITLRLTGLDESQVKALFRDGLADIAYFYALGDPQEIASRYAWSERISLFVSRDHPLAQREAVAAGDLETLGYVALSPDNIARRLVEQALNETGHATGVPAFESDNLYDVMKYVEGHNAYFAAFGSMARDFGKMSGIRRLAYAQPLPQVQVRQAVRATEGSNPAVLALAEFLFR